MTKEEKRIIKVFMTRTKSKLNFVRDMADAFAQVGLQGVSEKLNDHISGVQFDIDALFVKELKIKND